MAVGELRVSVERIPEALAAMRRELAAIVRDIAHDEPPEVARALHRAAARFEAGVEEP